MKQIPLVYWNELARQVILMSSLLGGFSIAITANLLVYKSKHRYTRLILKASTSAASCFLISLFSMTKILMMSTKGYPIEVEDSDWFYPRTMGTLTMFLGIISLTFIIGLSGWTKSKNTGIFTSIIGTITLLVILSMLIS
ncbi:hypothetical protein [Flammeovirga sp. SJP92]|uniref:hypothetical protein n=1 Tax=Flammeovirga sp. SJP92 TaxID=1775430 RepID=UPI0007899781|nr:hypothetical protein [Flammeovirga sp. SJP92]KXX70852.1 hypothetical protein AVL50_11465 [Flammeovirga sp. SJP92]